MTAYRLRNGFLPTSHGSIHLSLFLPLQGAPTRWVLYFPPFAEEMNKSRTVVASTARAVAKTGVAVIVPDLYGTGDSDGEFVEARWESWLADQRAIIDWAKGQGADEWVFWGLRAGCLLAAEVAAIPGYAPAQLMYWQPVHSGRQLMRQFLRLRVAATLSAASAAQTNSAVDERTRTSVAALQAELLDKGSLVIAGYRLDAQLFRAVEARQLADFAVPTSTVVAVLEVEGTTGAGVNPATERQLELWQQNRVRCIHAQLRADPFWATQELGTAPGLTAATTAFLGREEVQAVTAMNPSHHAFFEVRGLSASSMQGVTALTFSCADSTLTGLLHRSTCSPADTAVVIVVGGPQYRVGSHRQFVLLARALASEGYEVLRFDYRGMGDSEGELPGFTRLDDDIRCAINALQAVSPSIRSIVLWGLCDGATAAVSYGFTDPRVKSMVLANPWVYSEQGAARAYLKHYYLQRLLSPSFWWKLLAGSVRARESMASIAGFARSARKKGGESLSADDTPTASAQRNDLVGLFAHGLTRFSGHVLLLVSGKDLTAAEFVDASRSCAALGRAMDSPKVQRVDLPGVDHTFSRPEWQREVEEATVRFVRSC